MYIVLQYLSLSVVKSGMYSLLVPPSSIEMMADEVELDSRLFCFPQNSTRSLVPTKWLRRYPIHMVLVGGGGGQRAGA